MGSMKKKKAGAACPHCGKEIVAKRQSAWLSMDLIERLRTETLATGCSASFIIRKAILDLPEQAFIEAIPQGQKAISFTMDNDSLAKSLGISQETGVGISGIARFALTVHFQKEDR